MDSHTTSSSVAIDIYRPTGRPEFGAFELSWCRALGRPFHAPVFVNTHRGGERIEKFGGTSYTLGSAAQHPGRAGENAVHLGYDVVG